MKTIIIAAVAKNGVIGKENSLPWHLPEDFQHFKATTKGFPVIMGRRTFESMNRKPLPKRVNIVLSGTLEQPADKSYFVARTLEQALHLCERDGFEQAFIIGGARVYQEALDKGLVDEMILSELDDAYDGDTHFPKWDRNEWVEARREARDGFAIVTYRKE